MFVCPFTPCYSGSEDGVCRCETCGNGEGRNSVRIYPVMTHPVITGMSENSSNVSESSYMLLAIRHLKSIASTIREAMVANGPLQPPAGVGCLSAPLVLRSVNMFRAILAGAAKPKPPLKFPVTLRLKFPPWDVPGSVEFSSAEEITAFLSEPKQFLIDPVTGNIIRPSQVAKIDPSIIYDVAGSGLPYREKRSMREQVWDREEDGPCFESNFGSRRPEPHRIAKSKDTTGKDVSEWEGIYQPKRLI